MLVKRLKKKFKSNEPILTNEILELFSDYSRAYIFRLIEKAEKNGEIVNFSSGVYYMPLKTLIGTSTITVEDVVNKKYISNKKDVYGVYSGLNLQNIFSITTQMPNTIEVVSNNESMRCRRITIDGRKVILRKSRCNINSDNVKAYTILQLISELDINDNINARTREMILNYKRVNNIKDSDLISLAKVFPSHTIKKLIYSGVLNEFTQG